MRTLHIISAALAAVLVLLAAGCSKGGAPETDCVISWSARQTFTENSVYYTCANEGGDHLLCRYSEESGRSVPVCASPSCTHTSKRSPDCAALVDDAYGFYPSGDRLYYFCNNIDNSSIDLIECSANGLNKRTAASVEDVFIPFVKSVRYGADSVVLAYRVMYEIDEEKEKLGGDITRELEKPKVFVQKIDLASGKVTTLVEKEGYNASIWGCVLEDDILYYAFAEDTEKLVFDPETGGYTGVLTRKDVYRYGYYALDTKSGTERKLSEGYDCLAPIDPCFDHFTKDTVCYSTTDDKLYKLNSASGEFEYLADCYDASGNYVCDDRDALFLKTPDAENYTRFNFKTGAFTEIPRRECPLGEMYLNSVSIVGDTAWFDYTADNGSYCTGYTDRDEFFEGNFDNAVPALDLNRFKETLTKDENESPTSGDNAPSGHITLKWGIEKCSLTDYETELLNDKLREDGHDFSVEIVRLAREDIRDTKNFSELVADYEAENGALDIVTLGGDFVDKRGAAYNFVGSGYFRELTPSDKLREAIPEALWSAARVNGRLYTVPGRCYNNTGVTFYFNKKYVDAGDFGGDIAELGEILRSVTPRDDLIALEYGIDHLEYTMSLPDCAKGGLLLNAETGRAENPYENADVTEYTRTLNSLYNSGYLNYGVDFSEYDAEGESLPSGTEIAVMVSRGALSDLSLYFPEGADIAAVTLPSYLENRLASSTGISAKCEYPELAMEFLELLETDSAFWEILGSENNINAFSTGLPTENFPKADELRSSRFAGFELTYDRIADYTDMADALRQNYDRLCKAEDFDKELALINGELKAAGIDKYIALVNGILEEYDAAAAQ